MPIRPGSGSTFRSVQRLTHDDFTTYEEERRVRRGSGGDGECPTYQLMLPFTGHHWPGGSDRPARAPPRWRFSGSRAPRDSAGATPSQHAQTHYQAASSLASSVSCGIAAAAARLCVCMCVYVCDAFLVTFGIGFVSIGPNPHISGSIASGSRHVPFTATIWATWSSVRQGGRGYRAN